MLLFAGHFREPNLKMVGLLWVIFAHCHRTRKLTLPWLFWNIITNSKVWNNQLYLSRFQQKRQRLDFIVQYVELHSNGW